MTSSAALTQSEPSARDPARALRARPHPARRPGHPANLPEVAAAAVVEFLTGALVANPQRVGKQLRGDLAGIHSARRGTYRVLYRINDEAREVVVLRIDHRRDVYRGS